MEIDSKMTQMLDLVGKDLKAAIITILSYVQGDLLVMKCYKISAETETAKKKKIPEIKIFQDKFNRTEITVKNH